MNSILQFLFCVLNEIYSLFYSKSKTIDISDTDSEFELKTNHTKRPMTDSDDDFSPKRKPAETCKYRLLIVKYHSFKH